jgi:hypothetical protein
VLGLETSCKRQSAGQLVCWHCQRWHRAASHDCSTITELSYITHCPCRHAAGTRNPQSDSPSAGRPPTGEDQHALVQSAPMPSAGWGSRQHCVERVMSVSWVLKVQKWGLAMAMDKQ